MKTISDSVKNAFKQPTTKRKGVIKVNGQYYDIYNVEYYADCYDEGKVIGNAIASQLDFDISYMPKFDTFQYYDAIYVGNSYELIDYGTFTVFDEQDQDEFNKHITAFDNLIKFNKPFEDVGGYPKSLYAELLNICNQAGVTLANVSIPNGSFIVENNQFVNGESLKTVLKEICGINGTYGIVKNNNLHLQLKNITNEEIDKSQHEPVDWKRRSYGINQVIIGDSQIEGEYVIRQDDADIALNGVHKLEIKDNLFAYTQEKRSALIDALWNQVRGFGYIPYETKGEWLSYLEIGDTITIDDIETILLRVNSKSPNSLETTMSAPAIIDSSIEYVDNTADVDNRLKRTEISVDKQNQIIESVVSNVSEQDNKISQISQTVDEINAKISDVIDITTTAEDTDAQIELENINESEPIQIKIHPIGTNISYLYPSLGLFPSSTTYLKVRTLMFIRTYVEDGVTKTQEIPYELPDDLLYYDSEHFDEFYLDYDSRTCKVTKRCKYNADGTVGLLSSEVTNNYEYPTINLGAGDYTIKILGYTNAYLYARLMVQNIYTTQFYTKAETNSLINQTASSINLSVDTKLSNYSTTTEVNASLSLKVGKNDNDQIVSMINASADTITLNSNRLVINSTNFKLNSSGNITATGGTIGGWTLSDSALYTANNNYYLGTTGIQATIGETTVDNIIFKAGSKFGVSSGGTLYAQNAILSGATVSGTINATSGTFNGIVNASSGSFTGSLYSNNGTIGGWTLSSSGLSNSYSSINSNGELSLYPTTGGVYRIAQGAVRFNASGGIAIASSSNGSVYAGTGNLDIKGCSGHPVYIGCMSNSAGTTEKSCVSIENGLLAFRSTGYATYNGSTVWGSSSKATKENIKTLDDSDKDEVYKLIKDIPLISFDYKKQYSGQKNNYGFLIEDIENTKLKTLLHINQSETNKDIKTYSTEDLTRLELVVIQEMMKKIEKLEEKYE